MSSEILNKRLCRKCNSIIPYSVIIDNKRRVLKNRKFCFECSPFKGNNRHEIDPGVKGRRNPKKHRKQCILSMYKRGLERKLKLIDSKGGKCQKCGYSKFKRLLHFHHRNPEDKCFILSLSNLWSRSLDKIEKEANKCDILCANCHQELHYEDSEIIKEVNLKYQTNY